MKNQIKNLRRTLGISQEQCAADLGISVRTLQRWENGQTDSLVCYLKLADYLGVDLKILAGENDEDIQG